MAKKYGTLWNVAQGMTLTDMEDTMRRWDRKDILLEMRQNRQARERRNRWGVVFLVGLAGIAGYLTGALFTWMWL